jgi:hypothetical protein
MHTIRDVFERMDTDGRFAVIVTVAVCAATITAVKLCQAIWVGIEPVVYQAWDDLQDWISDRRERRRLARAHRTSDRLVARRTADRVARFDRRRAEVSGHATRQSLQGQADLGKVHAGLHQSTQGRVSPGPEAA